MTPNNRDDRASDRAVENGAIALTDLKYSWRKNSKPLLDIPSLRIESGKTIFVEGPSGSGKSTLLSLLAGVITPQQGTVAVLDRRIDRMSGPHRDQFRADRIGFIFQMFNLIPYLSVVDNVTLPCRFSRRRRQQAQHQSADLKAEALRLLEHLDMAKPELLKQPVSYLSVGQQQRVAAARALMGAPELIVADEPTSSLDRDRREAFIRLLFAECDRERSTLVFVSHDRTLARLFDRTIHLAEINRAGHLS
ncbi:ABC transporter ATP-binding protein [Synechococcus sp. PCC 7336]|uniref:ABC transporter ATP-binding protein n=1 Tax=Synechococcus sp. PCC 7336 TaxID=195250 RepID=UPI0003498BC9|nr:ABC transporter ATP-binding protein [Synechococcus sp. PCC 7336]